jgi:hypothetical protein
VFPQFDDVAGSGEPTSLQTRSLFCVDKSRGEYLFKAAKASVRET